MSSIKSTTNKRHLLSTLPHEKSVNETHGDLSTKDIYGKVFCDRKSMKKPRISGRASKKWSGLSFLVFSGPTWNYEEAKCWAG